MPKTRRTLPPVEKRTLGLLEQLVRRPAARVSIDEAIVRLERLLRADAGAQMAWETLPLSLFDPGIPETIRSIWVFILRGGVVTGAERHPNSYQRSLSYSGGGDVQTKEEGRWQTSPLVSDPKAPMEKRWASIPVNTWHQWVVSEGDWAVVSFHTVPAEQLIEERPARDDS